MDRFKKIQKQLAAITGNYLSATQSLKVKIPTFQENKAVIDAIESMDQIAKDIKKQLGKTTDILKESLKGIDWDSLVEFNSYVDLIDEYQKTGWAMPQQFLFKIYDEALVYKAEKGYSSEFIVNKIDDKVFFKEFEDYMISTLESNRQQTFRSTLKLVDEGYYVHGALYLFSVIEHLLQETSSSSIPSYKTRDLIRELKKDLDDSPVKLDREEKGELFTLYNMVGVYDDLLLTELFANHNDKPAPKNILIQRNPLSHGEIDGSKVNKAECYKLLLIILSLSEVKNDGSF